MIDQLLSSASIGRLGVVCILVAVLMYVWGRKA